MSSQNDTTTILDIFSLMLHFYVVTNSAQKYNHNTFYKKYIIAQCFSITESWNIFENSKLT